MLTFVCPHCGQTVTTAEYSPSDVVAIDLGNGLPASYFLTGPARGASSERHIDERVACQACWERAGSIARATSRPHPWSPQAHQEAPTVGTIIGR
jgi:hypothetical protein